MKLISAAVRGLKQSLSEKMAFNKTNKTSLVLLIGLLLCKWKMEKNMFALFSEQLTKPHIRCLLEKSINTEFGNVKRI